MAPRDGADAGATVPVSEPPAARPEPPVAEPQAAAAPPAAAAEPETAADAPAEPPPREVEPTPPPPPEEVDSEFLNALPESLRRELVVANRAIARFNRAAIEASGGSGGAAAAVDARDASADVADAADPESPGMEIMDAVDPEFLAALPPDMQAEVVQQQTREVQRRARERIARADRRAAEAEAERARLDASPSASAEGEDAAARRGAAEAAAAACEAAHRGALEAREAAAVVGVTVPPPASGGGATAAAPSPAQAQVELIASFPEDIRAEALMAADAATLAALTPALQQEALDVGLRDRLERARAGLDIGVVRADGPEADEDGEEDPRGPRGDGGEGANPYAATTASTFAEQLRSMLGLVGPGPSRGASRSGSGGPGPFGLTAADRSALAAAPAEPAVSRAALFALLRLLRVSPPLSTKTSGTLLRVLLNVSAHPGTRDVVIRGLLATTRAATETAEATRSGGGTADRPNEHETVSRGCGELFGRDAHATCPTPEAAARWVARRALETLVYLTRASHVFASRVALVAVTEADVAEAVARAAPISFDQTFDSHDADGEDDGVPDAREEGDPGAVSSDAGPLVLLRLLGSPAFESHAALVELALASLLSVLTASKKERERLARDWRCTRLGGHEPGAKPRGERRSDALEPWRLGFDARAGASSFKKKDPSDDGKGKGAAVAAVASEEPDSTKPSGSDSQAPVAPPSAPTLGGLRPLSSAAIRRAVAAAPPSTTRALARLVARDALTSGAQTKAFDLVKTLAAAAPEARAPLAAAFAAEAEARAADAVAALADAGAAAARRNARDAEEAAAMEKRSLGRNPRRPERLLPFRTPER